MRRIPGKEVHGLGGIDTKERTAKREAQSAERLDGLRQYSLTELEGVVGVSHRTLMRYVKDGKLKAVKIGGKWRVSEANLKAFLNGE